LKASADPQVSSASLIAVALYLQKQWEHAHGLRPGYRNNPFRAPSIKLGIAGGEVEVSWRQVDRDKYRVEVFDSPIGAQVLSYATDAIRLSLEGIQRTFTIIPADDRFYVQSTLGSCVIERIPRYPRSVSEEGAASSPMPGQVLKVLVEVGQRVVAGEALIILEAMKMEHTMRAAVEGVIEEILVERGAVVGPGQPLVKIVSSFQFPVSSSQ